MTRNVATVLVCILALAAVVVAFKNAPRVYVGLGPTGQAQAHKL